MFAVPRSRGVCATTTILLNRLKESNYRRRITHTHWRTHILYTSAARAHTHTHGPTDAHTRAQTHAHQCNGGGGGWPESTNEKTRLHIHTHRRHSSRLCSGGPALSAPTNFSALSTSRRRCCNRQPPPRTPPTTPVSPTRAPFNYPAHSFPFLRTHIFFLSVSVALPTDGLLRVPSLTPGVSLSLRHSRSVFLVVTTATTTSLFARGQQVKTCTDSRTADIAAAYMIFRRLSLYAAVVIRYFRQKI